MPLLIDGHNLIPKLGLRLESMDDELELIAILNEYARLERKQIEVYFDGAPASHAGTRKAGNVKAHFVLSGQTADDAIRKHLKRLGKRAKNYQVVSSDRQVQAETRTAQAEIISSESFAKTLKQARKSAPKPTDQRKLSQQEVDEWLKLFEQKQK